jgi:hypothetical protein
MGFGELQSILYRYSTKTYQLPTHHPRNTLAYCHHPLIHIDDPHTSVSLTHYPNPRSRRASQPMCMYPLNNSSHYHQRVILNKQGGIADESYDRHSESSTFTTGNGSLHTCISFLLGSLPASHDPRGGRIEHILPYVR